MASAALSSRIRKLIAQEMAEGKYKSQDDLLAKALRALSERREAIEGVRQGLADMKAGRMTSRKEFSRNLVKRHSYLADE